MASGAEAKQKEIQRLELEIRGCKAKNSAMQMYLDEFPEQVAYGNDLNGVQGSGMSYGQWLDNRTTETHQNGKSSIYGTTMQERFFEKMYENDCRVQELEQQLAEVRATPESAFATSSTEKYSEQEMINRAVEGNGITTGDRYYDSMGVLVPVEFARFIRAVGEAVGVERGNDQSNLWYYPNYDYDEDDSNIVRLEQDGIDEVVSVLKTDGMMAALNAYANGASWEESGMSAYNDLILKGFTIDDYSPEEKSKLAERMFWCYYIRNFGDVDTSDFSYDYGYDDGRGLSNYFSLASVEASSAYDSQRLLLIQDLKVMLARQLIPVNEAMGFTPGTPPVTVLEITDDDYDAVGNNYYTNQIVTYNSNYKDAADKLDNMITKLTSLYDSFNNATGNDITKIRNDLSTLINDLNSVKTKVQSKKRKTNENAEACQRCFVNWNNKYGKASINSEGIIYRIEITGEDDNQEKTRFYATIDEMLNS